MDDTLPTHPRSPAYNPATKDDVPFETPGRYGAEELELGRGGNGRVVLRTDVHLGRQVAVKELLSAHPPPRGNETQEAVERFLTEARVTARLEHPGVVPIYELGRRPDGVLYYAMKRVRGRDLEQALEACATLSDRLSLMQHMLDAVQTLAYAHANGVIHRDLKPSNVMVGEFGETQVLDWGLARVRGVTDVTATGEAAAASPSVSATQAGQLLGTPAYMSPEQAIGDNAKVDERSDVWCLGAMLFEVLTGQSLFEAEDVQSMLEAVKVAPVRKVRQLQPDVPRALAEVADRALQRDPARRYVSAVEMAEALEYAMRKPTVAGRPVGVALSIAGLGIGLLLALGALVGARRDAEAVQVHADSAQIAATRGESGLLARLAQQQLEKKDYGNAEALARQALASTPTSEGDPLARGILALLEGAARPTVRWEAQTPGCTAVTVEKGLVACPTFGAVELRTVDNGAVARTLSTGPTGWQHAALFLPDGTLLSAGDDRQIHVWDAEKGVELAKWSGHAAPIFSLASRGGAVASGALDGEVRLWEPASGTSRVLTRHAGPVRALAFTSNGELASSSLDGVKVWNLELKDAKGVQPRLTLDVPAQVAALGTTGLLLGVEREVFSIERDLAQPVAEPGLDEITAVATSPVAWLLAGDGHGQVRAFDKQRQLLWQLSGLERGVRALAVDVGESAGRLMLVASRGRSLRAYELPEDPRLWLEQPAVAWGWHEGAASARAALLLADRKGRVTTASSQTLLEESGAARIRAIAGANGAVIVGSDDGVVRKLADGAPPTELARKPGAVVTAVAVSRDGTLAALAWDDGSFTLWQLVLQREVLSGRGARTDVFAFSPDGRWLAQGRADRHVALLEAATGKELGVVELKSSPTALVFAGARLVVGLERGAVLFDVPSLNEAGVLTGPAEPLRTLSVSPDLQRIAGGSEDGQGYIWSAATRKLTHVLPMDAGDVRLVRFVDDEHLVAAGSDRSVRAVSLQ